MCKVTCSTGDEAALACGRGNRRSSPNGVLCHVKIMVTPEATCDNSLPYFLRGR